ncbi:VanZ family protein [Paenibacillus glycanilyticus]|uniref:VanZ family protein n=1 Tax=Paenibacillus glycanilyticus TaxID=126569 RepID=UPI00203E5CE8|nr:VanZ family protein [Paenibacillus glycanilyticus]MCM3626781.1 VanZ family protein [Paenibacillus glycanilyticus]
MTKREQIKTIFLYGIFIFYLFFIIKIFLLSRISITEIFNSQRVINRSINLIPFYSIKDYLFSDSATLKRFSFSNVAGNIIILIPLGTYLSLFRKNKRVITNLLFIFLASLSVEIIQGLLGIGTSDIDDIILNVLGGWIGIFVYKLLALIWREEKKISTVITVLSALGLPVIWYLLFMVTLRL